MPPAYQRLPVDERRRRLLALGAELFTQHAYDELTMAQIARAAGISKPSLYHYFPSKEAYFVATLQAAAATVQAAIAPDPDLPPAAQLEHSLDAYLGWIDGNATAYAKLIRTSHVAPEVGEIVDQVRRETAARIVAGLGDATPARRTAAEGWLWMVDGACLSWLEHRDVDREQLKALLLRALAGALGSV